MKLELSNGLLEELICAVFNNSSLIWEYQKKSQTKKKTKQATKNPTTFWYN